MGARKNLQGTTPLLDKVHRLQAAGFEVQAGFIMGLDTDPDDISDRMLDFITEAGIPVAMVGILGVLPDTPDYKRFERAGRLVKGVRYTGDSGLLNRQLSFEPLIGQAALLERYRATVQRLNSPRAFFERCLNHFRHQERRPLVDMPIRRPEVRALFASLWRQGLAGSYRRAYWSFLARTAFRHPRSLPDAVRLAVQGHHLILTTQQALIVDDVKTFLEEAIEQLERFAEGSRGALQQVELYAGRLMRAVHDRFVHLQDRKQALQLNAAVLLRTAQESMAVIREDFRHQLADSFARFELELGRILEDYTGQRTLPQSVLQGL